MNVLRKATHAVGLHVHRWPSPHHLYVDYPVSTEPRWGHGKPPHPEITAWIERRRGAFADIIARMKHHKSLFDTIGSSATNATDPYWENGWFGPLDAAALCHFLLENKPKCYIEIGSGNSTKFARRAVASAGLPTSITSIDPQPRAEINTLCDRIIRAPLETVDQAVFGELEAGDILFFDGSHRSFPDSDVTVFFLEILPRLAPGVLIQVHDIFWPFDYPADFAERHYNEQYMLGTLLLGGAIETVFPSQFIACDPELAGRAAQFLPTGWQSDGPSYEASYWFKSRSALPSGA